MARAEIAEALDRLAAAISTASSSVRLRPGISEGDVSGHAAALAPLGPPDDLIEIYRWHDGLEDGSADVFFDAPFPPLDVAIETYRWLVEFDAADVQWSRSWFPAFGTRQFGEFVTLAPRATDLGEYVWSYHYTDFVLSAKYDSLKSLIDTTATLWELGMLPADDPDRVAAALPVITSSNPRCFPTGEWLGGGRPSADVTDPSTWPPDWID